MTPPLVHFTDVPETEHAAGDIAFRRRRLGSAAGARTIGCSHFTVAPGRRQMPLHVHGEEEEIFYVAGGGGVGVEGRDLAYPVGPGDVVVHRPRGAAHTFVAGEHGLELYAFGSGSATSITWLPRAGVMWAGARWLPLDAPHPFAAEAAAGPLPVPELVPDAPRPGNVVHLETLEPRRFGPVEVRAGGAGAGAVRAGLNHVRLPPGEAGRPAHVHSRDEELFVVLEGSGTLSLGGVPHPLVVGDVIARPPSTGVTHALTAGPEGLVYLAYGTDEPGDMVHDPAAGLIWVRGLDAWLATTEPPRG